MGLDNVAVHGRAPAASTTRSRRPSSSTSATWPSAPDVAAPTAALAGHIAKTGTVRATAYTELVDLLLGLDGVLYATDAAAEDEDPVIDPDGCAWIAGGLERFVDGHARARRRRSPSTPSAPCCARRSPAAAWPSSSCAGWTSRLDALRDETGQPPQWSFTRSELSVLAALLPPLRRPRASRSTPTSEPSAVGLWRPAPAAASIRIRRAHDRHQP